LSPWDLAALRFAVAGPLLLPIVLRAGFGTAAGIGWFRAVVLATIVGGPYTLIMYSGLTFAPAAHGALIVTGGTPGVSSAIAWLWLGMRPSGARLAGVLLIIAGLVCVSWPGFFGIGGSHVWIGDLIFTVPAVLWGLFTVLARQWHVDPTGGTAIVWVL